MAMQLRRLIVLLLSSQLALVLPASAEDKAIVVASTTSTQDSGLFNFILPMFKAKTGIDVQVIAQGTGQALDTGRRGDADVVFVHAKPQEEKFVADGFGVQRFAVMYNDFVLIGPKSDPAKIKGGNDVVAALKAISKSGARLCRAATGRARTPPSSRSGSRQTWNPASQAAWYREIGQGMGAALNTAGAMGAYVLSDRGTWISFKNKADLEIVVEGDQRLFNQYGVILVNPTKHPNVKKDLGQAFIDWLISGEGQEAIRAYKIDGQQLFFPNANREWRHGFARAGEARQPRGAPKPPGLLGSGLPGPACLGQAQGRLHKSAPRVPGGGLHGQSSLGPDFLGPGLLGPGFWAAASWARVGLTARRVRPHRGPQAPPTLGPP